MIKVLNDNDNDSQLVQLTLNQIAFLNTPLKKFFFAKRVEDFFIVNNY